MAGDLTDTEVAQALGKHPRSIQRWCQAGKLLGAYKAGRSWRIPRSALRAAELESAFARDPIERELHAAVLACRMLNAEVEEVRRGTYPSVKRDWRRIARMLGELQKALGALPRSPTDVPSWL